MEQTNRASQPSVVVSLIPLAVLVAFLALSIKLFGGDSIMGASQLSLLSASAVCTAIAIVGYRCKWQTLEDAIVTNMRSATPALIILLLIGAIAGTWMASGVIPTLIYYGLKILHPSISSGANHPANRLNTLNMTLITLLAAQFCPATVTVHNYGDVFWKSFLSAHTNDKYRYFFGNKPQNGCGYTFFYKKRIYLTSTPHIILLRNVS